MFIISRTKAYLGFYANVTEYRTRAYSSPYNKRLNYSMGLVSSLLFFGTVPSFPLTTTPKLPKQGRILQMIHPTREELLRFKAEQQIPEVLEADVSPSAKHNIVPRDLVMGYNESEQKCIENKNCIFWSYQDSWSRLILSAELIS